jgi:hypothetical protein
VTCGTLSKTVAAASARLLASLLVRPLVALPTSPVRTRKISKHMYVESRLLKASGFFEEILDL